MARAEAGGAPAPDVITVIVAFSPAPRVVDQVLVDMAPGSTLQQAIAASGMLVRHPAADGLPAAIWGRKAEPSSPVRAGDRIEILRPLQCDPKEARRIRYRQKAERMGRGGGGRGGAPEQPSSAGGTAPLSGTRST